MVYAGCDYSLSSPGICVWEGSNIEDFSYESCEFFSLSDHKIRNFDNFHFDVHSSWDCDNERYENIAIWALSCLEDCDCVAIEGYSMGSKGKVFNIAENTGILKHTLWMCDIYFELIPPTTNKKAATGKGNATKEMMYEQWLKDTAGFDLKKKIQPSRKLGNPTTDLVDAYYLCRYIASLKLQTQPDAGDEKN